MCIIFSCYATQHNDLTLCASYDTLSIGKEIWSLLLPFQTIKRSKQMFWLKTIERMKNIQNFHLEHIQNLEYEVSKIKQVIKVHEINEDWFRDTNTKKKGSKKCK